MKESRLLGAVCACLFVFVNTVAEATLVELDWRTNGDGLITLDTATGLEWLDLTASVNMTYNEVIVGFDLGGEFEGFRHATVEEVANLYVSAGLTEHVFSIVGDKTLVEHYQSLRGTTPLDDRNYGITGTDGNTSTLQKVYSVTSASAAASNEYTTVLSNAGEWGVNQRDVRWAHQLVRVSAVPIPPALWLFGSGLLGLIGLARRRGAT